MTKEVGDMLISKGVKIFVLYGRYDSRDALLSYGADVNVVPRHVS